MVRARIVCDASWRCANQERGKKKGISHRKNVCRCANLNQKQGILDRVLNLVRIVIWKAVHPTYRNLPQYTNDLPSGTQSHYNATVLVVNRQGLIYFNVRML